MSEEQQNKSAEVDVVSNGGAESVDHHGHIEQVDLQTEMQPFLPGLRNGGYYWPRPAGCA